MADIVEGMQNRRFSASHWCLGMFQVFLVFLTVVDEELIGRFMQMLIRDRFINYHGQYGARLNSSQSIHTDEIPKRTWLIKTFSPFLFSAPNIHLESLNALWVDKITLRARTWKASILLNANVAFLSIPSNDPSNNAPTLQSARTAAQIASYLSVVTSFASMLLALILVRQHKAKERESLDVNEYHTYVHAHATSEYGFEGLAIVYSLPYALLTWGYVLFALYYRMLMCCHTQYGNVLGGVPAHVFREIDNGCTFHRRNSRGPDMWTHPMVHLDVLGRNRSPLAEEFPKYVESID
ncbi:hypothetical protein C0995_001205 [Termitomyces sp. Mi166|nr:hypothetical protein C0995_001205 [Termitomyces sp. Mi166\